MKNSIKQKIITAITSVALLVGSFSFTANAAALTHTDVNASAKKNEKTDFSYVSLGASNVNGYGLGGYNFDFVYETPFEKNEGNRYGYKMDVPGSYPVLIKDKLSDTYNVTLSQMAISSMRAEELRFIFDDSYNGDGYTDYWFHDINGDGQSLNYFRNAALYEWQKRAEAGISGYDHTPSEDELLATLIETYKTSVANADLITIDVGMNNFGTYLGNVLENDKFSSDLSIASPEIAEYYDMAKGYIRDLVISELGDMEIPEDILNLFMHTLAYELVVYCVNLDATIA